MSKFKHFIITAFNVDIGVKPREEIIAGSYLENRFQLFQDVSIPCVYNQTCKNFQWLVFFEQETSEEIKKNIQLISSNFPQFIPVYTPPKVDFYSLLIREIKGYLAEDTKFLITSNLDSDDAIGKDYIEMIQKHFHEQKFEYVNFPFGYILRKDGLFLREYLQSPLVNLIESVDNFLTCKVMSHKYILPLFKQGLPLRQILTHPIWLQVVHDYNWRTKLDINSVIQNPKILKNNFSIEDFANNYIESPYSRNLYLYLKNIILGNKYKLPLTKKTRNLINLINPSVSIAYLGIFFKFKSQKPNNQTISIDRIKKICLEQVSPWRQNY